MGEREPGYEERDSSLPVWKRPGGDSQLGYPPHSNWIQTGPNESPASFDLLEYWRILRLQKFFILILALLGLALALVYSVLQRPVYRAHTSIAIQDLNENFLNLKEDPTAVHPTGPSESYFQTQVQILQSESLLQRVIEKPEIAQVLDGEKIHRERFDWREFFGLPEAKPSTDPQLSLGRVASQLTVHSSGEARLVQVYFESRDPQFAADFANTLVSEFVEQSHQMRWESTKRTAEWLAAHLNEMKQNVEKGEAQLQAYARVSGLLFSEKGNIAEEKLSQLQQEYSKAQVDRAEKQAKYETARTKPLESLPETLDDATIRELGAKLAGLRQEKALLTSQLTSEHYKVRQIQAQIDELGSTLETERRNIVKRAGNEYLSARRREELLAKAYDQQVKTVSQQAEKAIHYDMLKHEVDTSRQLYDASMQTVKQAGLSAAMRGSNILVVDKARKPLLPYRPDYPLNSAIGFFIGTFCGVGFSILRERFSQCVVAPGVAPAHLNLPELGTIPNFAIRRSQMQLGPAQTKTTIAEGGAHRADIFMAAEAFRATITSLLLPVFDGSAVPGLIVVSSPGPGAGKTTVTCNLGAAMAQIGRRTLLIDADLRRPTLHAILGLSNSRGLSDLLTSSHPVDQRGLSGIVRHTDIQGLDLLPCGNTPKDPSHLLYSSRVSELFDRLRQEYDFVLVDTPPMTLLADARVLGRIASGVVLVIRAGRTSLSQTQFAVQRFMEDGTRVLGTILNGWDPKTATGTYYGDSYMECKKTYQIWEASDPQ
jgi:polysaccharide biosynthesis transport protein